MNPNQENQKKTQTSNRFETLSKILEKEEERVDPEEVGTSEEPLKETKETPWQGVHPNETEAEEITSVVEDMELGDLDLEGIEKACDNPKTGYIPFSQLILLQEAIIKTKGTRGLGVVS